MADIYKIAVIGSGPAGMSAAVHAAKKGISHILLEKTDHLSDTIFHYQKGKHIMATPVALVLRSDCDFAEGEREPTIAKWDEQTAGANTNVKKNSEVTGVTGAKGNFTITVKDGTTYQAENIIIAIGMQGNPNTMRCEGGDLPHVQYSLDDPTEYTDEHIFIIGGGDAGIENARGLAADPAQANFVSLINNTKEFTTAKGPNVSMLMADKESGKITVFVSSNTKKVEKGWITVETPDGEQRLMCDRIIARIGAAAPRRLLESWGIKFSSPERSALPILTPDFESVVPGVYIVGALAGYPLIKHCMNQGYDAVEIISGNTELKPADQPLLEAKVKDLPIKKSVDEWIEFLNKNVEILHDLSRLQMREFLLDCTIRCFKEGEVVFRRNDVGPSLFGIAQGTVRVEFEHDAARHYENKQGSIFGEVALISGRRRGGTVVAGKNCICVEIPRTAALKLMNQVPAAKAAIERITTERQLLEIFGADLSVEDAEYLMSDAIVKEVKPGEAVITEGVRDGKYADGTPIPELDAKGNPTNLDMGHDIYTLRTGSMMVEKEIGGKTIFMSYIAAGSYFGEMALIEGGSRTATVRASARSVVVRINGDKFKVLLKKKPALEKRVHKDMDTRNAINNFIEQRKKTTGSVVQMYSDVAEFLVKQGIGDATDVLLINEKLCVGCDNCEKACADTHDGLSRLNREAGRTYAHLHVPTSCRHCEHPYCMTECPPNAIRRGPDGEVFINQSCIGCGNCQRNCPYGVIRMDTPPDKKPSILWWLFFGHGPGPGEPNAAWRAAHPAPHGHKIAIKCDMCVGREGGPSSACALAPRARRSALRRMNSFRSRFLARKGSRP